MKVIQNLICYFSAEINHTYFNSMTFLHTSYIHKNQTSHSTDILYSKVRSLIIGRSDCDIILHRLVRLSYVRELTLIHNTDPVAFINLLNLMIGLESLRLLRNSEKILLLLKDNRPLKQCLQKRAIRKLFLKNSHEAEDL